MGEEIPKPLVDGIFVPLVMSKEQSKLKETKLKAHLIVICINCNLAASISFSFVLKFPGSPTIEFICKIMKESMQVKDLIYMVR